jgi:hypothetical protein
MINSGRFRVSLHVSHSTRHAEEIIAAVGLQFRYARSAGSPRINKIGNALGGHYTRTDVSFDVSGGVVSNDDVLVADLLRSALLKLPLDVIDSLVSDNGTCFFLVGIYSEENILCDFDVALLSQLAKHAIGLKLDIYGGPETQSNE